MEKTKPVDEYKPCWIFGSNENLYYASYNGDKIGVFVTFSLLQFGLGFNGYYHIISKGSDRVPKLIIDFLFLKINLTYHK